MKRPKEFIFNGSREVGTRRPDFYGFEFFDHDLILFCDRSSGYRTDADGLTVIGGRSAKPLGSAGLFDALGLVKSERGFLIDFLSDGSKEYCMFCVGDRVALAFNRLFRTSGLGIVAVLDYPTERAASAVRHGLLDRLGEGVYSPELSAMARASSGSADGCMDLVYSVLRLVDAVSKLHVDADVASRIRLASDIIGCPVELVEEPEACVGPKLDADSLLAILLCQLSLCRRISVDHGGRLSVRQGREHVGISLEYEVVPDELNEIGLGCLEFCERLSLALEMPLSVDLSGGRMLFEFVPYRVDPSLYGLKAGVRINYTAKE